MDRFKFKVKFFIHHKSGKLQYGDIETFVGEKGKIFGEINDRVSYLQKRINKKFTYDIVLKEKIEDDSAVEPEESNTIQTKSKQMSAEDAIAYIKDNPFDFLEGGEFISEDETRITVNGAYDKKREKEEQS